MFRSRKNEFHNKKLILLIALCVGGFLLALSLLSVYAYALPSQDDEASSEQPTNDLDIFTYFTEDVSGGTNRACNKNVADHNAQGKPGDGVYWDASESCAVFDGQSYYKVPNMFTHVDAASGLTISWEAWISDQNKRGLTYYRVNGLSATTTGWQRFFDFNNGTTQNAFFMVAGQDDEKQPTLKTHLRVEAKVNNVQDNLMQTNYTHYFNAWHNFSFVVKPKTSTTHAKMYLYVDGQQVGQSDGKDSFDNFLSKVKDYSYDYIGTSAQELTGGKDGFLKGKIRNFRLVNASNVHKITFQTNGGTSVQPMLSPIIPESFPVTTRDGYNFAGWYEDPSFTIPAVTGKSLNSDIILYAKWTENNTYKIEYNGNNETSGFPPGNEIKEKGVPFKLASNSGNLKRDSLVFSGWNTRSDGNGTHYDEGDMYTTDANIVLYAEWKGVIDVNTSGINTTYDGQNHQAQVNIVGSIPSATVKYRTSETAEWSTNNPTFKDAFEGKLYYLVQAPHYVDKSGEITIYIKRKNVEIKADAKSCTYGDQLPTFTYKVVGAVSGETPLFDIKYNTITQKDAGTYNIIPSADSLDQGNYHIETFTNGTLTINKKSYKVTTASATKIYDGAPLVKTDGYVVDGIVSGETYSMLITGTITNVGTQQNTYTIMWDKSAKEANYDLQSQTLGTLEVTHRATVITAKNCSKTYGDNDPTFDFTATNLVSGETKDLFEINYTRDDVEDVGEYNIVPNGGNKGDKQGNYKLTFSNAGKLTITKRELKIKTFSSSRQYNGMDLTADGTSSNWAPNEGPNAEGSGHASFSTTGKIKNVGSVQNTYEIVWTSTEKSTNYTISEILGVLTVIPANISVYTPSYSKVYDGDPLTYSEGAKIDGLAKNESASLNVTGTQTSVGNSANTYEIVWDKTAIQTNYKITSEQIGTLLVNEYYDEIPFIVNGWSKEYDGTEHVVEVSPPKSMPDGYTLVSFSCSTTIKDVGVKHITLDNLVIKNKQDEVVEEIVNGEKITDRLKILLYDSYVQILKKTVVVTSSGDKKVFDGTPLQHQDGVVIDGFVAGETYGYEVAGSQTHAGSSANTVNLIWASDNNEYTAKADNYEVVNKFGDLVVEKKPISIATEGAYSSDTSKDLTNPKFSVDGVFTAEEGTIATDGSQKGAGASQNTFKITFNEPKYTNNDYVVNSKLGMLCVGENIEDVYIQINGGTFTYDGQNHQATLSASGANSAGYDLTYTEFNPVKNVKRNDSGQVVPYQYSSSDIKDLVVKKKGTEEVVPSGKLKYIEGQILINPAPLSVVTSSASKVYDGTELTASGVYSGLVNNETIGFSVTGSLKYFVEDGAPNNYEITWSGEGSEYTAIKENYEVIEYLGTLTIVKANAKFFSGSASKVYDGKPLVLKENGKTGVIEGDLIKFESVGSITEVGSTQNNIEVQWYVDDDGNSRSNNYNFDLNENVGTLTVEEYNGYITLATDECTFEYNGKPQTCTINASALPVGYKYESVPSTTQSLTDVGKIESVTCDNYKVLRINPDKTEKDVTLDLFDAGCFKFIPNSLEIMPRAISVATYSAEKTFDNTPLTTGGEVKLVEQESKNADFNEITPQLTSWTLENNETVQIKTKTSITNADEVENDFELIWKNQSQENFEDAIDEPTALESNYTVAGAGSTVTKGKLTVLRRNASITANDKSKVYGDADPDFDATLQPKEGNEGFIEGTESDIKYDLKRDDGEDVGDYLITAFGNETQGNYNITYVSGQFTISPKDVVVTAKDAEKMFGDPDPEFFETSVEGLVGEDTIDYTTLREPGESVGNYVIAPMGDQKQGNYFVSYIDGEFIINEPKIDIDPTTGNLIINHGKVKCEAKASEGAVKVNFDMTTKELWDIISKDGNITEDDYLSVAQGQTLTILIDADKAVVSDDEKAKFMEIAKGEIGTYVDISFYTQLTDEIQNQNNLKQISETGLPVKLKLDVSSLLDRDNFGTFELLRSHNNVIDVVDSEFNAKESSVYFSSDKFSNYAISYLQESEEINASETAVTGDNAPFVTLIVVSIMSAAGVVAASCKRKFI